MKQQLVRTNRKELETRMTSVFGERIRCLSTELQRIFVDDMVTAFESRLTVLQRAQADHSY